MLKTRTWILMIVLLLILALGGVVFVYYHQAPGTTAQIIQDGTVLQEIDLAAVSAGYTITVTDEKGGSNTISVEHGRIAITEADCPDQICVKHGWISLSGDPIVCLPHKLTVRILSEDSGSGFDTTVR